MQSDTQRWMRASERLRKAFRGRKGREELEALLDDVERAALEAGREIERASLDSLPGCGPGGPRITPPFTLQ